MVNAGMNFEIPLNGISKAVEVCAVDMLFNAV